MKFIIFLFVKYSTRTFHPNLLIYSLKKPSPVWGKIGPKGQFSLQTSFLPLYFYKSIYQFLLIKYYSIKINNDYNHYIIYHQTNYNVMSL